MMNLPSNRSNSNYSTVMEMIVKNSTLKVLGLGRMSFSPFDPLIAAQTQIHKKVVISRNLLSSI